ncbi:MAG: protein translocase subunit SecD [Phycisphaerae bacterium]
MNGKNLFLKFFFVIVILLAALSAWGLMGLKYGIDLRGGHSLTFRVEAKETDSDDIGKQVIEVLKERIDPYGLHSLEFKVLSGDRIQIRMPAVNETATAYRREYQEAIKSIQDNNITLDEARRFVAMDPAQREQRLEEVRKIDPRLVDGLKKIADTYTRLSETRQRVEQLRQQRQAYVQTLPATETQATTKPADEKLEQLDEDLQQARNDLFNAQVAYEDALDHLNRPIEVEDQTQPALNVPVQELQAILSSYVSAAEAEGLRAAKGTKKAEQEIQARTEQYKRGVEELLETYPNRQENIEKAVAAYKGWMDSRTGLDDPADLKRLIRKAGILEFRIVPQRGGQLSLRQAEEYEEKLRKEGPVPGRRRGDDYQWFEIEGEVADFSGMYLADWGGKTWLLMSDKRGETMTQAPGKREWSLDDATPTTDEMNTPAVRFKFDPKGAKRFAELTGANVNKLLGILLDDTVYSAPVIKTTIYETGTITGRFSPQEVREMVRTLRSGSLPARVNPEPVAEHSFGPTLGEENRKAGVRAAVWGLILVGVFMLMYYLIGGFLADVALLANLILVLGAMSLLEQTFTLPGIAGLILTIGMAVDANVLIFERLREEQDRGLGVRMALKNAYERAFSAILDANVTTLFVCLILGWVGTTEIRGFAITLGFGIAFSMFTSLVLTRWIFQLLLRWNVIKKPLPMLKLLGVPKINWIGKRYVFWAVSATVLVIGLGSIIWQGKDLVGIDFSAGTEAIVKFDDDALIDGELPTDGTVEAILREQAGELGYPKLRDTLRVETRIDTDKAGEFIAAYDADGDERISLEEFKQAGKSEEFFRKVDADSSGFLRRAELEDSLPTLTYKVSTTDEVVSHVREAIAKAFGDRLVSRNRLTHEFMQGRLVDRIGVSTDMRGSVQIDERTVRQVRSGFTDAFSRFRGGFGFAVRVFDDDITTSEIAQRIEEMQFQPDYQAEMASRTQVLFVDEDTEDGQPFRQFFVLVERPISSGVQMVSAQSLEAAQATWAELIEEALLREESIETQSFDATLAEQQQQLAIVAIILSWAAIIFYLWLRFGSPQWGLAAVVCLVHDIIIVVGLVAATGWLYKYFGWAGVRSFKIDLPMVAALLTVIGYSVNDTIVVFDRIRENRGKLTSITPQVINASINQTLPRTLLTSITTLIVVVTMYTAGGEGIKPFSFALLMGILFGTYSSITIASPLLLGLKKAVVAKVVSTESGTTGE